ncbi:MAG: helix-turn-helix domain-containing protein [Candidatus Limnocylindria bacterium]
MPVDRLLGASELAELLNVPESWVREETRQERIPHVRLGRYRRYRWEDVLAWLEEERTAGGAHVSRRRRGAAA